MPIVPAAILFDLWLGERGSGPTRRQAMPPAKPRASGPVEQGNVGAGTGCTVGKLFGIERAMRGGLGSASLTVDGITVGALVAVNAIGDVVDPATGQPIAGARTADGQGLVGTMQALRRGDLPAPLQLGAATTLGIVATDASLTKAQATKLAQMAHDGFARAINPVHTLSDGDTIFALATGAAGRTAHLTLLGALAAEATAIAIVRAVRAATALDSPRLPSAGQWLRN